jgi:hypothetical protein
MFLSHEMIVIPNVLHLDTGGLVSVRYQQWNVDGAVADSVDNVTIAAWDFLTCCDAVCIHLRRPYALSGEGHQVTQSLCESVTFL